jgi:hypothetical protein
MKTITNKRLVIAAYIAFAEFVARPDLQSLLTKLVLIEKQIQGGRKTDKGLWFRFFKNDTGATTIADIQNTFLFDHLRNQEYYLECINIALNEISLELYYS